MGVRDAVDAEPLMASTLGVGGQGILLVHGLAGSPQEFSPLAQVLSAVGYQARVVTLPGHGKAPQRRLQDTSAEELLAHVLAEAQVFSGEVDQLYLVGHSLGGICALLTSAMAVPRLQGTVAFAAPYEHAYFYNYWQGLGQLPLAHLVRALWYAPQGKIRVARPRCTPWDVPKLLQQSQMLFTALRQQVPKIAVPVSLAHSPYDLVIPYAEMGKLASRITPGLVQTTTLRQCGHRIFPMSSACDQAHRLVLDFIQRDCRRMAQQVVFGQTWPPNGSNASQADVRAAG